MKTRENTQNPQSSRGTSTLYKRLGVSNHFHTLFLISNENLTPTSYTFSEFLTANFRENRKQKSDFEFFHFFAKTRKIAYNRRKHRLSNKSATGGSGPKFSPLQRVTLQSLKSCYCWSILLKESVSNLAPASAQNQPKIWKYAWEVLIFLLHFLTF